MQIVTHRFYFRPGNGFPENGLSTMRASIKRGLRNHEWDIAYAGEGPIVDHDFSAYRNLDIDEEFAHLSIDDVEGKPILIRRFQSNAFATESTPSQDSLQTAENTFKEFLKLAPDGTGFPDCRDQEIAEYWADLSHQEAHKSALLMFYTFAYHDGKDVAEAIKQFNPHPDWRARSKFVLNFYPSELITVATRRGMPADTVEDLFNVGKAVLESFPTAGIKLFGLVAMCSGLTPDDFDTFEALTKEERSAIYAEQAMVKLVGWARTSNQFPHLKIGSGTRAYDCSIPQADGSRMYFTYSLMTGRMVPWPTLPALRKIKERYSTPGVAEILRPDFLITDEPERAALPCCGIPADDTLGFKHPRFDTVPEQPKMD
ncbi:MAG: hypothetical protein EOR16_31920 [Mesorhizobium sp.]|uniref:hypothetical protein n=1 Tax=Mesorhizobium sp. TaxID=1871066 RepID=UPI000FE5E5C6|nr:hypothetical protein [Mesorhizobium sp.]RWI49116.1 MAG: hypothetical protein EOR16_31920 [Mesorhizobium sp.]